MSGGTGSNVPDPADVPVVYAIRLLPRAERDINEIVAEMIDTVGAAKAKEWQDELFAAIAKMAENPRRYPKIQEWFPIEVRQMLYPPAPRAGHRVLFAVRDETDPATGGLSPDGPIVAILHLRHTRARPISRTEARAIATQNEIPLS
jgi:plasmid stabilization system protein ParE